MNQYRLRIMSTIYFVTSNDNKVKEARKIIDKDIERVDLDIAEIQTVDVKEAVEKKAAEASKKLGKLVMVEDTGLYFDAWNGFPGALVKWMLGKIGNRGICKALDSFNRSARAKTAVCLHNGESSQVITGEVTGEITEKPCGETDFGWDPIFRPDGKEDTFAEMKPEEKNSISHRKRALSKLKKSLEDKAR